MLLPTKSSDKKAENSTRAYQRLLPKHPHDEYGTWEVKSEDDSYGGPFDRPIIKSLGLFEGTWEQVVKQAVLMDKFYTWGNGGDIIKMKPRKVTKL